MFDSNETKDRMSFLRLANTQTKSRRRCYGSRCFKCLSLSASKVKTMIRENMEMDISMTTCNSNIAPPVLFVCFCFLKYSPLLLAIWSSKPLITHLGWQRSHRYMSGICCLSIPMQSMCCQTLKKQPQIFSYFKQNFRNCVCAWHMYLFFHRDLKIRLKNKT